MGSLFLEIIFVFNSGTVLYGYRSMECILALAQTPMLIIYSMHLGASFQTMCVCVCVVCIAQREQYWGQQCTVHQVAQWALSLWGRFKVFFIIKEKRMSFSESGLFNSMQKLVRTFLFKGNLFQVFIDYLVSLTCRVGDSRVHCLLPNQQAL